MTERIAIYGGTFDPIHFGHIRSISEFQVRVKADAVRLVPSYIPPHRALPGASPEARLAMLALAAETMTHVVVDDRELLRQGTSYTVDTVTELRAEYGPDAQMMFVLGSDAFALIHEWHDWQALTNFVHLVVMDRAGFIAQPSEPKVLEWLTDKEVDSVDALQGAAGSVARVVLTPIDISATMIRQRLQNRLPIDDLVPINVAKYIRTHKLYDGNLETYS